MSIKEGELLTLIERFDDGWCSVRTEKGEAGIVPDSYCTELKDEKEAAAEEEPTHRQRCDRSGLAREHQPRSSHASPQHKAAAAALALRCCTVEVRYCSCSAMRSFIIISLPGRFIPRGSGV